jgi:hypothetical protein
MSKFKVLNRKTFTTQLRGGETVFHEVEIASKVLRGRMCWVVRIYGTRAGVRTLDAIKTIKDEQEAYGEYNSFHEVTGQMAGPATELCQSSKSMDPALPWDELPS